MKFIPYGCQDIRDEDIEAVVKVLKSDFLTQGPEIGQFESRICKQTGARFATVCSSGTAALHLAILSAGIGKGDRVLCSPVTFVASANCARYVGAEIEFADIDPLSYTISPDCCREILEEARASGRPIRVIITVDLAGHPCDMETFDKLKKEFGFIWIQDACHSIGGSWKDSHGKEWKIGEYPGVDMTVFSFHPVKHITSGEGGAITTHSERLSGYLKLYRTHGITKDVNEFVFPEEAYSTGLKLNPWYYEMKSLGFNYRLTDFQAALGESQLRRLDEYIIRRQEIAELYQKGFKDTRYLILPKADVKVSHAYHLYVIRFDFVGLGKTRATVMKQLRELGIGTQVHYIPVPMMPYYAGTTTMGELPNALAYYREALSVPMFPNMTNDDVERVINSVEQVISQ